MLAGARRNRSEVQAYLARRGTRYGNLNNDWSKELNKLKRLYGEAAYLKMVGESDSLFAREAMVFELKEAKNGNDGNLVVERKNALRELYDRARTGG